MTIVGEATSGREAIESFRTTRPDITLMDLQMPDMDGIDAILAIRSEFPNARVIVLTTYEGDALAYRALKAGARAYILKSMVRKDLLSAIRTVHAGHKHIQSEVAVGRQRPYTRSQAWTSARNHALVKSAPLKSCRWIAPSGRSQVVSD
jgi:DNA-binding NarL/FixJ family response regulator